MRVAFGMLMGLCALLAGCATTPQARFYLVPDPEGKVGEVTLTNKAGSVVLNKANETVDAPGGDQAFTDARQADTKEIEETFGDAFMVMPLPPRGFNIYFDSGSAKIKPASEGLVAEVLAEDRKRDSRDVSLNGHTDRVGDKAANMELSLRRADTVKTLLMKAGVLEEYIQIEYYGESKPIVPTKDNVDEPLNRRVEVVVR